MSDMPIRLNKKTGKPIKKTGPKCGLTPEKEEFIIKFLALGFNQNKIAEALNVGKSTLNSWINKPKLRTKIAAKKLLEAEAPALSVLKNNPLQWLERVHKDDFAPPAQRIEQEGTVNVSFVIPSIKRELIEDDSVKVIECEVITEGK